MEKRTYGAPRLVDWVAQIKAGGATVRVHFTGGALTAYGVTPAEYTTCSPFIQKVIEQSAYFKEGRIELLRVTEVQDAVEPVKGPQKRQCVKKAAPAVESRVETPAPAPAVAAPTPAAQVTPAEAAPEVQETQGSETEEEAPEGAGNASEQGTVVEVACLQDAQAYLQEHFGLATYKVRTCEAAQRAAGEHGVRFVGAKFDSMNAGTAVEE